MAWDCNDGCWWRDDLAGRCTYSKSGSVTPPCMDDEDGEDDEREAGRLIEASDNQDPALWIKRNKEE